MIMKQFTKWIVAVFFALSFLLTFHAAEAHSYNKMCKWVPGHWKHGFWYPAQKVCTGYKVHCKKIEGHWRYGHWYPPQKVCWYR